MVNRRRARDGSFRSSYEYKFAEQVRKLAALGATVADMAAFFGVSERVIASWQTRYPDFGAAVRAGRRNYEERERLQEKRDEQAAPNTREKTIIVLPNNGRD